MKLKKRKSTAKIIGIRAACSMLENLEERTLLSVDLVWQNPFDALDVNNDGYVSSGDAVSIVNELNSKGARELTSRDVPINMFVDTSGDGFVSPMDALLVINHLNSSASTDAVFALVAGEPPADRGPPDGGNGSKDGGKTSELQHTAEARWAELESSIDWNIYVNSYDPADTGAYDSSRLAWGHWYYGFAMQSHYRRTGDVVWLERMMDTADVVLPQRADRLSTPMADEFTNTVRPLFLDWGTNEPNRWHGWAVHNARAVEAALYAASVVKNDPGLDATYGTQADNIVADATAMLAAFDGDYLSAAGVGKYVDGYFTEYSGASPLPFNHSVSMVSSYIWLWKATGNTVFRDRATELSQYFKNELLLVDDHYEWRYAEYRPASDRQDVSHALVEINAVVDSFEAGLGVFDQTDIARLAKTLEHVYVRDKGFTEFVNGRNAEGRKRIAHPTRSPHVAAWLRLTLYDDSVRSLVHPYFESLWESTSGWPSVVAIAVYLEGDQPT